MLISPDGVGGGRGGTTDDAAATADFCWPIGNVAKEEELKGLRVVPVAEFGDLFSCLSLSLSLFFGLLCRVR